MKPETLLLHLITEQYAKQTKYRPQDYQIGFDGRDIHVWGYLKYMPYGYKQIGSIVLCGPDGPAECIGKPVGSQASETLFVDVFAPDKLSGIMTYDFYQLPAPIKSCQ